MFIYYIFFGIVVHYIKSELTITSFEIGTCDNQSHALAQITLTGNEQNLILKSVTFTDTSTNEELPIAKCSQKQTYIFLCYFKKNGTISNILKITKYNDIAIDNNPTTMNNITIAFSSINFSQSGDDFIYKYFQQYIYFYYNNINNFSTFFIPYMYTFQVSSSSVTTRINGNCEAFSNSTGVQCLFDLNSFKNHKEILTFSFVDKCQTTTNFTKGISISSLKEITNSKGYSSDSTSLSKDISIVFDYNLSTNFNNYLSLKNEEDNLNRLANANCYSYSNMKEVNCTNVTINKGVKYYLYFKDTKISENVYIAFFKITYSSSSTKEIHIGDNICVNDLMNLTVIPPLKPSDLSSCSFNHTTDTTAYFPCKLTEGTNNTSSIGPKNTKISAEGDYYLNLSIGQDSYTTKDLYKVTIQGEIVKPAFTDFIDGIIAINYNESYIVMNFNDSTNLDKLTNFKMISPAGGTISNCFVNITTIKNVLYNLTQCNVSSIFTGYAIFTYEIFGQLVTIPKEFPIYDKITNIGNYFSINQFFFIIIAFLVCVQ